MTWLAITAVAFVGLHILPATPWRSSLIGKIGEKAYRALFSLTAIVLFVLWVYAFKALITDTTVLWWWPWVQAVILLFAAVLFVAGISTPNPTLVQSEGLLKQRDVVYGVVAITRHPGLTGFGLWGATHFISQPNWRGFLFFGVFALFSFVGMVLIDRRRAAQDAEAWRSFAAQTSRIPFLAIVQRRAKLRINEIGWIRIGISVVLWVLVLYTHNLLFGAPAFQNIFIPFIS